MAERLGICAITPDTPNWTCKVQVVDICRPGESSERKIKYLNMIFQDEQDDQIKAIIYGDDIPNYEKIFRLFHTYLITGARLQLPNLRYEKPLHTFEWVIDKKTIIDPINKDNPDEQELPPPTKLTVTSFRDIKDQASRSIKNPTKNIEHNVLAIVVKCFLPRYVASVQKTLQELIIIDTRKQTFTFTIWEESIIEDEGKKLLGQFQEYPIILARRIGVSKYNGISLTTKFNTTIQINPPYQQCLQLRKWIVDNKEMLASFIVRSTSTSGSFIYVPVDEEIVPIANVQSQQDGHTFFIEAKISLLSDLKCFYVLICPNCGQEVRSPVRREIHCMNCNQQNMLTPRCRFDVNLQDTSGSILGMVMGKEGEKILSLTAEEVYELASVNNESLQMQDVQSRLSQKLFKIQVKKAFARNSGATSGKLYIVSCFEKENIIHSLPAPTTTDISEGSKRKKEDLSSSDGEIEVATERGELFKLKQKLEPTTPVKMK